jgi:hypothetical protein
VQARQDDRKPQFDDKKVETRIIVRQSVDAIGIDRDHIRLA